MQLFLYPEDNSISIIMGGTEQQNTDTTTKLVCYDTKKNLIITFSKLEYFFSWCITEHFTISWTIHWPFVNVSSSSRSLSSSPGLDFFFAEDFLAESIIHSIPESDSRHSPLLFGDFSGVFGSSASSSCCADCSRRVNTC